MDKELGFGSDGFEWYDSITTQDGALSMSADGVADEHEMIRAWQLAKEQRSIIGVFEDKACPKSISSLDLRVISSVILGNNVFQWKLYFSRLKLFPKLVHELTTTQYKNLMKSGEDSIDIEVMSQSP